MWATKREHQQQQLQYQEVNLGSNTIFLSLAPVVVSVAVQVYDIRPALIAGTALAGFVVGLGFLLYILSLRRIPLYLLDAAILIALIVQLGVSYPQKHDIARCFNFILFATLAGLGVVSMLIGYPFTLQHIREQVPREAWRHPHVMCRGFITTAVCVAMFTINTMLYIIPIAKDTWWDPHNGLTIAFQVVIPIVIYLLALLAVRMAPGAVSQLMVDSEGFNVVTSHNPLANL